MSYEIPKHLKNNKVRLRSVSRDYPGSYGWPNWEIACPCCLKWTMEYGDVEQQDEHGNWQCICNKCGEDLYPKAIYDMQIIEKCNQ